jgi:hypothetical protein
MHITHRRSHLAVGQEPTAAEGVFAWAIGARGFRHTQTCEGCVANEHEVTR